MPIKAQNDDFCAFCLLYAVFFVYLKLNASVGFSFEKIFKYQ